MEIDAKKKSGMFGKKHSEESKKKMSLNSAHSKYWLGKKHPLAKRVKKNICDDCKKEIVNIYAKRCRQCDGLSRCGENNHRYIKDRTKLKKSERKENDSAYQYWRLEVYKRDRYICKINNKDCSGKIEAHHILPWRNYKELRYEINNGITLCHKHHPRKRNEELKLVSLFKKLLNI